MSFLGTSRQIGRTIKNASRLRTIVGVFAKHGFHNIAERVKLGRYIIERLNSSEEIENLTVAERVRMSFEELGPTFVKLGQLLATRPDLVPDDFVQEFAKLHDRVQTLDFATIENLLKDEFGADLSAHFSWIDPQPLGSASIAQVHKARLITGEEVVVKVQRPGIIHTINEDLNVLYFLAELLEKYIPETRMYNPMAIVDEYFKTLELETNFVVEANNIRRFQNNFKDTEYLKIPEVFMSLTTEKVLTMEALKGVPLSAENSMSSPGTDPGEIIKRGLNVYLKMVFNDGLFHGDLHPGNFFVMPDNQIGLIDFGVVGRLNSRTQSSIINMLVALAKEDYERLAYEYIDLAPFDEKVNPDLFAKDLRNLLAPHFGLTLKNVNTGKILLQSSRIASKHHVALPTDLMLFFKSLVGIESLGRKIQPEFDFLSQATEFATELVKTNYDPQKIMNDAYQLVRESKVLIENLPRQLNFLLRKINSPNHAFKIHIQDMKEMRVGFERTGFLFFSGFIIAALIIGASIIFVNPATNFVYGMPTMSFVGYVLAAGFFIYSYFKRS